MIPRRVGYIVNVFPKLSETFIAGELAELCQRGLDVRVLSLRRPTEELRHEMIDRACLSEKTVYDPQGFSDILRDFNPDVLHAHFATEPTAAARHCSATLGVKFTFTAHGYDIYRRPPSDFSTRAAAAGAVVTVSKANANHITKTFGVPANHIRVIPCGVDIERFRPSGKRTELPIIVCVARLNPVKNLGLLLKTCALLQKRGVRFHCVVIGEGPCRRDLEVMRAELELDSVVEFIGAAEQSVVLKWWRRAAVGVLTSDSEGMPLCLTEAAACGVPVVATAVGGVPELVQDGVTGLLTPRGDAEGLAKALERLLSDSKLAARLGKAARQRAEEHFSVQRQVNRLLELWRELV